MEGQAGTTRREGWGQRMECLPGEGVEFGRLAEVEPVKRGNRFLEVR